MKNTLQKQLEQLVNKAQTWLADYASLSEEQQQSQQAKYQQLNALVAYGAQEFAEKAVPEEPTLIAVQQKGLSYKEISDRVGALFKEALLT